MARIKRRVKSRMSLFPVLVLLAILVSVGVPAYKLYSKIQLQENQGEDYDDDEDNDTAASDDVDRLPLYRDIYRQEPWPGVEWNFSEPSPMHDTAHYLWCGQKTFRFQDYLSVLSVIRVFKPLKLVFHFTHLPTVDAYWYNTWFQELKQSASNLELRQLDADHPCDSVDMLKAGLRILSKDGGLLVGEGVLVTKSFENLKLLPFWFSFCNPVENPICGVVFVNRGFNENSLELYVQTITTNAPKCLSVDDYNQLEYMEENPYMCVDLTDDIYPKDIRSSDEPFAEMARWLFYGRRDPFVTVNSGEVDVVPNVAHCIWLASDDPQSTNEFTFVHFLSVLSALHVGQLDHVYLHGDAEPGGIWWEELQGENVTFAKMDVPENLFMQEVEDPSHKSYFLRYVVLEKYGGVYQDLDVLWVSALPDWLRGYPTVLGTERAKYGAWPDAVNLGVVLARRNAPFLRHFLSVYRQFEEDLWNFLAKLMPYRVYEWYPDTVFLHVHLQAVCSHGVCRRAHARYVDNDNPDESGEDEDGTRVDTFVGLGDVSAVHFRLPKTPASLVSPGALVSSDDLFSRMGRFVLQSATRQDILPAPVPFPAELDTL